MPQLGDSVAARKARRANSERGAPCIWKVRMSGVFGQQLGRRRSTLGGEASSVKYSVSSADVWRHGKYEYERVKPTAPSRCMTSGRAKASERNRASG